MFFFLLNLLKLIHSAKLTHYTSKMDVRKRKATAALVIASGFVSVEGKSKKRKKWKLLVVTMVVTDKGCLQHDILNELRLVDKEDFRKYLRMNTETFEELLSIVEVDITKQTTRLRRPEQNLAVTRRYLATGETFESLMYQFRIHRSTISQFVPHVCDVIYRALKKDYLTLPSCEDDWLTLVKIQMHVGNSRTHGVR